jgi:hypothetical protein
MQKAVINMGWIDLNLPRSYGENKMNSSDEEKDSSVPLVGAIESAIKVLEKSIPRCEHKQVVGRCPYCDKCKHGKTSYSHCEPCHANDDQSWRTAKVSDAEIAQLRRWFADYEREYPSPHHAVRRYTPYHKRNFRNTEVSFLPMLLDEFIALRKRANSITKEE